jgi:hypothetical protein
MMWGDEWEPHTASAGQPAVASSVTIVMPEAVRWILLAVCFRIVTDANVANRTPVLTVLDGSGTARASVAAGVATVASKTADYTFANGLAGWVAAGTSVVSGAGPVLPLQDGDSLVISVDGVQAGDQVSRVRVTALQRAVRAD